jgi:Uncharacterized proteins, LmbE homologs
MEQETKQQQLRILVIAAHPDDIEFGAGGSLARWADEGAAITLCLVTDGSAGSNDPNVDTVELAKTRQEEQRAAAAVLGISDVRFLGYRDGTLQASIELRRELTRLIRELKPQRVLCQDPTTVFVEDGYINHPDHRAAGEAAIYAVFPSAETRPIFPELLAEGYEPHHVDELYLMMNMAPNHYVDITSSIDRKIQALLCHRSQVGPEVEEGVRKWAIEDGKAAGMPMAEGFRVMTFRRS